VDNATLWTVPAPAGPAATDPGHDDRRTARAANGARPRAARGGGGGRGVTGRLGATAPVGGPLQPGVEAFLDAHRCLCARVATERTG